MVLKSKIKKLKYKNIIFGWICKTIKISHVSDPLHECYMNINVALGVYCIQNLWQKSN